MISGLVVTHGVRRKLTRAVDITQHDGSDVDSEDIVAIRLVRGNGHDI